MRKVVLDADGLIKLTKADILEKIVEILNCNISQEVFTESVEEGKKLLFEDAFKIEELIQNKKIKVHATEKKEFSDLDGFGKGERTSLELYYQIHAQAIISDNQRFLKELEKKQVPFTTPAGILQALYWNKKLNKSETLNALEKMKPLIQSEIYISLKKEVEESK